MEGNNYPFLYNLPNKFNSVLDCLHLCPRLGYGGRVPAIENISDSILLDKECRNILLDTDLQVQVVSVRPFVWEISKGFVDFYTKTPMPNDLWAPSQPNGNESQPYTFSELKRNDGRLYDYTATQLPYVLRCQCQFPEQPILRLRGLCKDSIIDNVFSLIQQNRNVTLRGITNTEIRFSQAMELPTWVLSVNFKSTKAQWTLT